MPKLNKSQRKKRIEYGREISKKEKNLEEIKTEISNKLKKAEREIKKKDPEERKKAEKVLKNIKELTKNVKKENKEKMNEIVNDFMKKI